MILGTALILLGCKNNPYTEVDLNPTHNTYTASEIDYYYISNRDKDTTSTNKEITTTQSKTDNSNTQSGNNSFYSNDEVEIGSDEWLRQAKIYLSMKQGETYHDSSDNRLNPKRTNKKTNIKRYTYSTTDIQYSEEWRIRAFKITKEYLIEQFPIDNKGCNITGVGYYNPHYVKYIGNNQFQLRMIINFKCNNDKEYTHRKRLIMVTQYDENQGAFGFALLDDDYLD